MQRLGQGEIRKALALETQEKMGSRRRNRGTIDLNLHQSHVFGRCADGVALPGDTGCRNGGYGDRGG